MDSSTLRRRLDRAEGALGEALRLARSVAAAAAVRPDAPPRALLVGGLVRDALLGLETLDVDVEVFGLPAPALEHLLEELFPGRVNTIGRSFGIFRIHVAAGDDLDVSLPRTESKNAPGHRGFEVRGDPFLPFAEAARRRDFTVNALGYDPSTGSILDAHGGLDDLERRRLRAVDPRTFPDDPLRVWRAFQLAARLEMVVDPETKALMQAMVRGGELADLSRERVTDELRKLLSAARPSPGLALAREVGAIATSFPELELLAGTEQDAEWHPEGDVWVHTLMVVDAAAGIVRRNEWRLADAERVHVMLAALLHDVGKPRTTERALKEGRWRIVSPRHEAEGEPPARAILGRLTFGEAAETAAIAIVRWHLSPGSLYYALERGELDDRSYTNAVRKVLKRIHPVRWQVLLAACEADWRGRGFPGVETLPFDPGSSFARAVERGALDVEPVKPLVQGRDVLELGLAPGPEVGRLIDSIEEARDRGEIEDRAAALEMLRRLVSGDREEK